MNHYTLRPRPLTTSTKGNILHLLVKSHNEMMRHDITVVLYMEVDEI
ncbi:hypothetical protein UWK_02265 [Desulfocapsa sulfexigens DSM 10523]|uniref:Uncharacterized protein n=1 Tax=Desulfocapsa sulfexigens (strain DSM 10523 / SB164P1) TaxID=1167006 RepID=M1PGN5_DESSD|nr:hypothetical protein UWK_02265 [Desulfocapsa sulfexigens DSM 10523]